MKYLVGSLILLFACTNLFAQNNGSVGISSQPPSPVVTPSSPPPPPPSTRGTDNTAQEEPSLNDDKIFVYVQQMPQFHNDISRWLADNIIYPEDAKVANAQGTTYLNFVVEKDGSVTNVKVIRSSGNASLDNEGIRAVSNMPRWTPGIQNGKPVRVEYNLPVHFRLENQKTDSTKK